MCAINVICAYIRCSCASRRQAVLDGLCMVSAPEFAQQEPMKIWEELGQVEGQKKRWSKMEEEMMKEVGGLLEKESGRKGKREMLEGLCLVEVVEEEEEVVIEEKYVDWVLQYYPSSFSLFSPHSLLSCRTYVVLPLA